MLRLSISKIRYRKEPEILYEISRKNQKKICLIVACLLSLVLTTVIMERRMEVVRAQMDDTQQALAKEVFRFHVIAESDSEKDQNIKLKVRDSVLDYMKAKESQDQKGVKATKLWVTAHKDELEQTANRVLKKEGVSYRAKAEITTCYFPEKWYGDVCFPEGNYEALRLILGKGNGHNWWCVLYPNMCFKGSVYEIIEDDAREELREVLDEEEYEAVFDSGDYEIRFKILDFLKDRM